MLKLVDGTELTEEVKEAFKKSITSAYIKMNDGTILSSANYLKTIKLEDFRYNEETGNIIGEAISKRVSLSLFNQENALNIENKEFELIIGTQLSLNEENNFYDIDDVLLMSEDMTINDDDSVTATFDNTEGTEAQYLNLFANVSGFLATSSNYVAILEILDISGTGVFTITDSSIELESFPNFTAGTVVKYNLKSLDNFLNSDTVLKTYAKFNPGESGSITFRISIFQNDINMNNFEYKKFNSNNKYISFGNFIVQRPENNDTKESTDFEAFDYMCKANKKYVPGIEFPCTYAQLAEDVCNQCGLELGNNTFRNADKLVSENFFIDSEQCRVVLKEIAKIAFSWVRVATDNKVYFDFHKKDMQDADEIFTLDDYIELEPNDETIPVNTIVLRNSAIESENITIKDDDLIAEYGKQKELVVKEDYFAYSQEKRQELIEASRELMGLVYYPVNLKSIGTIYLESNDIIGVEDKEGNILNTYCFNHTIDFNGVLFDRIESPAMTEVETELQHESAEDLSKRKTEIIVNKAMQQIEATIKKDDVIARINMALEKDYSEDIPEGVDKSVIQFFANNLEWNADHSSLSKDGILTLTNEATQLYEFTVTDVMNLLNYIKGDLSLSEETLELYDVNGDGNTDILDATKILNIIEGKTENTKYATTKIILDPTKQSEFIKIQVGGLTKCILGISEVYSYSFRGMTIFLGTFANLNEKYGVEINGEIGKITVTDKNAETSTVIDAGMIDAYNVYASSGGGTGHCMHGTDKNHTYRCNWGNVSGTNFFEVYIDNTKIPLIKTVPNNAQQISQMRLNVSYIEFIVPGYGAYSISGVAQSDTKLKYNIKDSTVNGLDIINKIRHIEFDWKECNQALREGHEEIGHSANQIRDDIGNDIAYSIKQPDGMEYDELLQLNYDRLMPYITKSIQELDAKCKEQQKTIDKQQKVIDFLVDKLGYSDEVKELLT